MCVYVSIIPLLALILGNNPKHRKDFLHENVHHRIIDKA